MTRVVATIDEVLASSDFARDPYPTYRRLMALDSPYKSEARGGWLVARFDDVVSSLRDWGHFSSEGRVPHDARPLLSTGVGTARRACSVVVTEGDHPLGSA